MVNWLPSASLLPVATLSLLFFYLSAGRIGIRSMVSTSVKSNQGAKVGTSEITCVIYARVSTDDQADRDFSSVDAQIAGCRRKAEDNGWIILREYRDDGASGKNLNRPAMKELIALIKRENVGAVIAVRMDRLSRDAVNTEFLIDFCKGRQTEIVLLQQVLDENSASGRMNRRMNSVLNQYERESTGDRVRFKIEELARNGMRSGGWTPPGYVLGKAHEYSLDERYAPMIRRIFEQAASGTRVGDIAAGLKADGYVVPLREINRRDGPKKIGGRPFTWDQVKHMIKNPFYKGVLVVGTASKEFTSNHEAIVSSELWNRANVGIERNGRPDYKTRQNKHELLLHGLVYCGCCRGPLVVHPGTSAKGKAYLYYRCQNLRKNGRTAGCSVGQVPARKLEDTVIDHIGILAQDPVVLDAAMDEALKGRKTQLLPLKGQIASLDEEIRKLNNFVRELRDRLLGLPTGSQFINQIAEEGEKAVVERQELEAQKKRLMENKSVLEQQLGDASQMRADLGRFSDIFAVLPYAKKQQALRLIIRKIVVNRLPKGVTKSSQENGPIERLGHNMPFSVDLDLYVKPKFPKGLGKTPGLCVFDTEMAARAGIEPATK